MAKIPNFEDAIPQGGLNKALWVGQVLSDVFGVNSPVYIANAWFDTPGKLPNGYELSEAQAYEGAKFEAVQFLPVEQGEAMSEFGLPVFGAFKFTGGEYNTYSKDGKIEKVRIADFVAPYSCLVDFTREKVITETQTLGGTGTVKELYGLGDWQITIRGIAFAKRTANAETAHAVIRHLVQWSNICDSVIVEGNVFAAKGIENIVIKSLSIQPIEAKYNVIPFTIEAVSDEPVELLI